MRFVLCAVRVCMKERIFLCTHAGTPTLIFVSVQIIPFMHAYIYACMCLCIFSLILAVL